LCAILADGPCRVDARSIKERVTELRQCRDRLLNQIEQTPPSTPMDMMAGAMATLKDDLDLAADFH